LHRENQLLNLEICTETASENWLKMNKTLEKLPGVYEHKSELLTRKIRDSTISCRNEQEKAYPEIMSLTKKRLDSFLRTMNCQQAIVALSTDLRKRGMHVAIDLEDSQFPFPSPPFSLFSAMLLPSFSSICFSDSSISFSASPHLSSFAYITTSKGVDVAAYEAQQEEDKRRKLDPNNAEYNTTVRAYETVNSDAVVEPMEVC
jgi:hypothetical protein